MENDDLEFSYKFQCNSLQAETKIQRIYFVQLDFSKNIVIASCIELRNIITKASLLSTLL